MVDNIRFNFRTLGSIVAGSVLSLVFVVIGQSVSALDPIPEPDPKPGSYGLEATKPQAPPKRGATITTPGSGASFSESPITVSGICPDSLLVEVYNNGVLAGATVCRGGSFSVEISLFTGENELSALVYDDLDQPGPKSNVVTVTYNNTSFEAFGEQVTLTSSFARRSAAADSRLTWPLQLSGGTGPYAFSIDWGDGSPAELKSQAQSGVVNIAHVYKSAGIYTINVKVTDVNGVSAFLQLVAVANGEIDAESAANEEASDSSGAPQVLWAPTVAGIILLLPAYWLGRQSQLVSLRNKMLKERDSYKKQ